VYPRYYALRRLNPYRGVVHMVEAGEASAHTYDGVTWYLRADDGYGWVRPTGVWVEGGGLKAGQAAGQGDILAALESRPPLPYPLADGLELWLLDQEAGLPLALLGSERPSRHVPGEIDPTWQPFALRYTGFRSAALAEREAGRPQVASAHRDALARLVNAAARPGPAAQWFRRTPEGGEGLEGLRLKPEWEGRALPAGAFPELLVREEWNNRLEQSVINDYHAWLAPLLLLLPRLAPATRERLEKAAALRPGWLLKVHRLLPAVLDRERLNAALVAARMEESAGGADLDFFAA